MAEVDDLINTFASYEVTPQPNSTAREHPRFSMYKVKTEMSQEKRRKKFLDAQKLKRFDYAAHARGLATNQWDYYDDDDDYYDAEEGEEDYEENDEENEADDMDCEEYRKPPRSYKDQLMLSEWLVEVPNDLESQWLFVFCPVGKRCLVVASRNTTKVYTKSGYCINSFGSKIPGGSCNSVNGGPQHVYSLLDCIFNEEEKTYYILDIMCWNSHPCFDSETEFRSYWLHSKIAETPEVTEISKNNPYKFLPLPYYSCEKEKMREVLFSSLPFKPKLDGILFYHKKTHYNPGTTPLVGWLKGYMLPEMLGIDIPNEMASEKPITYTTMQEHVPEAFKKNEERKIKDATDMQFEDD